MKKTLALILAAALCLSLCLMACGKTGDTEKKDEKQETVNTPADEKTPEDTAAIGEKDQTSDAEGVTGVSDETIVIGAFGEPNQLVTQYNTTKMQIPMANLIYDALLMWDDEAKEPVACIATEWEQDANGTSWSITIRDDIVAYDGTILTAEDIIYSFAVGVETGVNTSFAYFDMENSHAVDDTHLVLSTWSPMSYLPTMLSNIGLLHILDESSVEANGGFDACVRDPKCGTGPYRFAEWKEGEYILLERNEEYWGELPYYKTLKFQFISDAATRALSLESGDIDVCLDLGVNSVANIEANDSFKVWIQENEQSVMFFMNTKHEPFDNALVRKAMACLINKEAILQVRYGGYGSTMETIYPYFFDYCFTAESEDEVYSYDIEKAKAYLKEAGYEGGFSFNVNCMPNDQSTCEILQAACLEVGITMNINVVDMATSTKTMKEGNYDALFGSGLYGGDITKALHWVDNRLSYSEALGGTAYGSDELNALIDTASFSGDNEERNEALKQIQQIIRQEVPLVGICNISTVTGMRADITGLTLDCRGMYQLRNLRPVA